MVYLVEHQIYLQYIFFLGMKHHNNILSTLENPIY